MEMSGQLQSSAALYPGKISFCTEENRTAPSNPQNIPSQTRKCRELFLWLRLYFSKQQYYIFLA
jgi:hypothetical protein